ncbi:titin-like [Pogonomyrmex barbatus]|uniref:Titin-like n=1 Tax=Pogonomyrmex barbatus TaxID=144034 RepID=A0A6I9WSJ9_9HYME|nr:titin-like [Pogonomyrmex barbatus]
MKFCHFQWMLSQKTHEIFRTKDIETESIQEQIVTKEFPVNSIEKIADRIDKEIDLNRKRIDREPAIIQEEIDIPSEKILDIDYVEEKIDLNEKKLDQEVVIIEKEIDIPSEKIPDIDYVEEKIDLNEKKLDQEVVIIEKEIDIPSEKIPDIDYVEEKIDLNEKKVDEEVVIIEKEIDIPSEKIPDIDYVEEKIDLNEKKLDQEVVIEKEIDIPEKIPDIDYVEEKIDLNGEKLKREDEEHVIIQEEAVPIKRITDEKIDFVEKEDSIVERVTVEPAEEVLVAIEKQEIIEDEIERAPAAQIDLEISQELEKDLELKELEEYVEEEEEGITDYEKFIDEELRELLPAVIAREIPEEPREVERREISRNAVALYNGIDRERPVRAPREPEAVTAMPEERPVREEIPARALEDSIIDRIVSREPAPVVADVCDETYCLVWKQRERIIRKLKERQRIIDHYYLTKDFSYFEDVCTCSLACMVYTLSRDPFVRSIFASLALFAVGLKLCSELDAWEMPSRVS